MMIRYFISVPVFLMLIAAAPAAAADFTINVPVTIENMPSARRILVFCSALRTADGTGDAREIVGNGSSAFAAVTDGRFSGTLTVAFNANASSAPALARSYNCKLSVYGVASDGREFDGTYNTLADVWAAATGQRVTVEPTSVSGRLVP